MLPAFALAHGTKVELTSKASAAALEKFENESTGLLIRAFEGVKAWPTGTDFRIKIYLKDMDTVRMVCVEDHGPAGEVILVCENTEEEGG